MLFRSWATSHADFPKWGHVTSNISESMNSWILEMRDQSYYGLHVGMVQKCTDLLYQRRQSYESEQAELPPQIRERIRDVASKVSRMDVRPSSSILYNVNGRVVNLQVRSCSWLSYKQTQFPCVHMAAAISIAGVPLIDFVHEVYKVQSLCQVY